MAAKKQENNKGKKNLFLFFTLKFKRCKYLRVLNQVGYRFF